MGTLKGAREKKGNDGGVEIFPFLVLVIFCFSVYTTHKISHGGVAAGTVALELAQNGLCEIKENNKHVRGIWTSAVTRALTARPRQFHESKRCCLGFSLYKAKSTFILRK